MRIAYFDCFSGAAGDMILGALLDVGLRLDVLKEELAKLHLSHYDIEVRKVVKNGIGGTLAVVHIDHEHHGSRHRHFGDIEEIIGKSDLSESVKGKSLSIFRRLAEAEAEVHRTTVDQVHFHEVGAMDAIIDVVGSVAGLESLGIGKLYCSPLHVGTGTVECAHGMLPVPAPATAELLRGKPFYSAGISGELLTPTGAAILTTLASSFGPAPSMTLDRIGYGAGTAERAIPNLLRIFIGEAGYESAGYEAEQTAVIETNIDDMNPQVYGYLIEQILDLGALDVFLSPVQMKKNRPGILFTVLCKPHMVEKFSDFLLRETTAIGIRWRVENRFIAHRSVREVETPYGIVRCKVAESKNGIINIAPEYEDCKRIALERHIPLKEVMEKVKAVINGCL
ncbi:MAG: nickel pincer cofactor biosynthesis protein LarC [Syntrophobacteraceae bacterium]